MSDDKKLGDPKRQPKEEQFDEEDPREPEPDVAEFDSDPHAMGLGPATGLITPVIHPFQLEDVGSDYTMGGCARVIVLALTRTQGSSGSGARK